jgi:hypothetical protein
MVICENKRRKEGKKVIVYIYYICVCLDVIIYSVNTYTIIYILNIYFYLILNIPIYII